MTIHGLCRKCGKIITYVEPGLDPHYHVTCGPNFTAGPTDLTTDPEILFAEPDGSDPHNDPMARDFDEVVLHAHTRSERSQQITIGPSELGDPCERKLAYRVAGIGGVNDRIDPWPALVGTAIHQWLEAAINQFQVEAGAVRWLTEVTVQPDDLVLGHCDLYDLETCAVWDFKTTNSDKLRKYREQGPPEAYRVQVHLYGLGMTRAGYQVERVGLIALPRSGWLSGKWLWSEPYDPTVAAQALSRMYRIAEQVMKLEADRYPERILEVTPTPSQLCSFCEFYTPEPGNGPGCPGR